MIKFKQQKKEGLALLEAVIATSIVVLFLSSLIGAYNLYLRVSLENLRKVQATFLAEEGVEALRLLRDNSWSNISNLSLTTDYKLVWNGVSWATTTNTIVIDGKFFRTFRLGEVLRDSNSDIVLSSGTSDQNSRKITVKVEWNEHGATSTKIIEAYTSNLFN